MSENEINLEGIDLSNTPHASLEKSIINRIDYPVELFNIKTNQTKKINISCLVLDTEKYYGFYIFYCADEGFSYQALTHNLYATYQEYRQPYEAQGWRFKSKGARPNAQVSGMLVGYGGFDAYLIDSANEKPVSIFAYDENITEQDTVIAQKAFHEKMWSGVREAAGQRGVDEDLVNYVMGK